MKRACVGQTFYLLQCRPQSHSHQAQPAAIPKDIPERDIIFSAKRYVSNGIMPEITHIVYVDPQRYGELETQQELVDVGRAVSHLNSFLPKRQFVLMGPGRWGSRGDIKLGVSVTYSDINNTSALIEVARRKGNYTPDLSFGTHFFQDLVESAIRYLPLYPDDLGIVFNENFLLKSPNVLSEILPAYAHLADVVRVIDVPAVTDGRILKVAMNADLGEAMAWLAFSSCSTEVVRDFQTAVSSMSATSEMHWQWRMRMVERIAEHMDHRRLGVVAIYVIGSTKNGTAGPGSDIDLLLHFHGDEIQRRELDSWLNGWSICLDEVNYLRTGYRCGGLIDAHFITDDDVAMKMSFAAKIGAVTDAAKLIPLE